MTDVVEVQGELQHGKDAADERMRLHVALAQVLPNESDKGDVPIVLPRLRAVAAQAASRGADIIVFPEYFLSGSSHEAWHEARNTDPLNTTEEHPEWLDEIQAMARELSIAIVTGSAVILHDGPDETLFNIVFFIDYRGEVRGSYTKRHLWHAERAILSNATEASHPSDDQPPVFVFETKRGLRLRTSMVMCWDLMFPEAFRRLLSPPGPYTSDLDQPDSWAGPDVVFAPTCWYADDSGPEALMWNQHCEAACLDAMCIARAMENECFVCMCNAAGPAEGSPLGLGRSSCSAPLLGSMGQVPDAREKLLLCTLPMEALLSARRIFKIRHDMGTGVLAMPMHLQQCDGQCKK